MPFSRREFITTIAAGTAAFILPACTSILGDTKMYGLIGKMRASPGQRDALIAILLDGVSGMPGCLSYVVAKDASDADAIWITEVWDSQASHKASLSLPSVQDAISRGKPLIAGIDQHIETAPIGGHGLRAAA
jgi:quinol monooxygenase YgiN